jgi:hypothetical protein
MSEFKKCPTGLFLSRFRLFSAFSDAEGPSFHPLAFCCDPCAFCLPTIGPATVGVKFLISGGFGPILGSDRHIFRKILSAEALA